MEPETIKVPEEIQNYCVIMNLIQILSSILPGIGLIAVLIMWTLKKEESEFIKTQGIILINFQVTLLILTVISAILSFIFIGIIFLVILAIINIAFPIIGAAENSKSKIYIYPFSIRFIK